MRGSTAGWWVVVPLAIGACTARSLDSLSDQGSRLDAAVVLDAGVADASPSVTDGSASIDALVTHLAPTHLLAAGPIDAMTIAADESGVFWTTSGNALWMLPVGADALHLVAQDPAPVFKTCYQAGRLIAAGDDLFWVASRALPGNDWTTALHRTSKDGTRDDVIAEPLIDGPITLVADETFVYWNEITDLAFGGASVRSYPRGAAAGWPPVVLVGVPERMEIAGLAVNRRSLYWTPFNAIGTTIFTGELYTGDKPSLAAGDTTAARFLSNVNARMVVTHGDDVFLTYWPDLWNTRFGRVSAEGAVTALAELPDAAPDAIVFVDRWAILSLGSGSCGVNTRRIVAVPLSPGTGTMTTIAEGAVTPVALGAEGITFVNAEQQLVAISKADLSLALTASP